MMPRSAIFSLRLDVSVQPLRSMGAGPGLKSSIHSSLPLASVPIHATSLMSTTPVVAGRAVGTGLAVGSAVAVLVAVAGWCT